jgi:hypothetical protein
MIDIKRTFYTWSDTEPVATGMTVSEEGQGLVRVMQNGIEAVMPSQGVQGEVFVGFAMFRQLTFGTAALVEQQIIPTAAPFTVELTKQNLIADQFRIYSPSDAIDLTPGLAVAPGVYVMDIVHGTISFNGATEGGKTILIYYRYNLTVAESILQFYQAPTNMPDPNFFNQVGVGKGKGRLYTMFYDQSVDWSQPNVVVALTGSALPGSTTNGMLTNGGAGPEVPNARVVNVPSPTDPYLGIEFLV